MTTDTGRLCDLCEGPYHHDQPAPSRFNLICPGTLAPEAEQDAFLTKRVNAWLVFGQFGEKIASDPDMVADMIARREAWYDRINPEAPRERAVVTHQELQKDVDKRTPEVVAMVDINEATSPQEFEAEPAHLTVHKRFQPQGGLIKGSSGGKVHIEDYGLFLDPPEGDS
jgi:hypothetical protein